jgi:hypothetical protein
MCARVDDDDALREVLLSDPRLAPILSDPERFRAQVLVSEEVPSGSDDVAPALVTRGFRAGAEYFYPASTVKLFVAVAACVEIQRLARRHHPDAPPDASHPGRPLPRFRLGLDTKLAFERRGLAASVADARAKTDAALRRRDRVIRLAEARLAAMERAEADEDNENPPRADGTDGTDGTDGIDDASDDPPSRKRAKSDDADFNDARAEETEDSVDLVAAARVAAGVFVDERSAAAVAADYASFESAYVASSVPDDVACVSLAGEGLRTFPPGVDPAAATTLADELRKLFLVSDNEAYNRCYDVAGPSRAEAWARRAPEGAGAGVRVRHRLWASATDDDDPAYLPAVWASVRFVDDDGREEETPRWVRLLPARRDDALVEDPRRPRGTTRQDEANEDEREERSEDARGPGRGDVRRLRPGPRCRLDVGVARVLPCGTLASSPMNCAERNAAPLVALQAALKRVATPLPNPDEEEDLTEAHRERVVGWMSALPRDEGYDPDAFPDHHGKFFLPGILRATGAGRGGGGDADARGVVVTNKLGRAYGFTADNARIADARTGRAFYLAAAVETNANGVVNDDAYEYETAADPFMERLAETVTQWLWGGKGKDGGGGGGGAGDEGE